MMTAEEELAFVRPHAVRALEALRVRGHSQMHAYEALASLIGKSPTWVRGVIGRDPNIGVRLRDAINLTRAYDRLCKRIEAAADAEEARIATLTEELHAALSARGPVAPSASTAPVARTAASGGPGRAASTALVRSHVAANPRARSRAALDVNDLPLWRAIEGE
ncbi:hypothetical protein FPV16_15090 [Methylobacterium sp. W2]|uniref:hypothetical protein n=1 Tax=Methylobacterium sp. W2 TaxID=2598107 RepID=UPI001D0C04F4|nr:hypothetical protein [Methylobacterium sp. W2]MCC0807538.1 hypothetical protein [Methylobacterium sp. W2]